MTRPTISIVTATYNCSHWLKFAISSVLNCEYQDWELNVVGDHCTDDTEAVVSAFGDPRIRFYNLPVNSGQQATPNNYGVRKSTGEYLCFLNQDDMFMPWHLDAMLDEVRVSEADVVLARAAAILPFTAKGDDAEVRIGTPTARTGTCSYTPRAAYLASTWFMPMRIADSVGPWRTERQTYVTPSQDWLFRAWKAKKRIVCAEQLSVILIHSGARADSYRARCDLEHRYIFDRIVTRAGRGDDIEKTLKNDHVSSATRSGVYLRIADAYFLTLGRALMALGVHPRIPIEIARHGVRRGSFVRYWARKTGALEERPGDR